MSCALPESMREYIDHRVASGNYGNTSESIRDLIRRDQEDQSRKRLRELIEEGLASDQVELDPGIGSPTLGKLLGVPGLRTWRVAKFPLLWCCFERADHLDVVRLLGDRQDMTAILGDEIGPD